MIDSHTHIHIKNNYGDLLKNAEYAGVTKLLNIICLNQETISDFEHIKSFEKNTKIKVYYSMGVHPAEINKTNLKQAYQYMEDNQENLIAFGEAGLDMYEAKNETEQLESFADHVQLCQKYNKTLIIHTRQCDVSLLLSILKNSNIRFLFHCWTFGIKETKMVLEAGGIISFSGIITFKNTDYLQESLSYCPMDRILLETDAPWLAPVPLRGTENESAYVKYIYDWVSKAKKIDNLKELMQQNFNNAFNLSDV